MRGFLIWALLILLGETVLRLASWSLLVVIPWSVVECWTRHSDLRWIATVLTGGFALFLYARRKRLARADFAKAGWLLPALLAGISIVALGPEPERGYTVLGQPAGRLSFGIAAAGLVFAGAALWRAIERRNRPARLAVALAGATAAAVLLPGALGAMSLESAFRLSAASLWPLPAGLALGVLSPALWIVWIASAIRRRDGGFLRENWFVFSLLTVSAVIAAVTMARIHRLP